MYATRATAKKGGLQFSASASSSSRLFCEPLFGVNWQENGHNRKLWLHITRHILHQRDPWWASKTLQTECVGFWYMRTIGIVLAVPPFATTYQLLFSDRQL